MKKLIITLLLLSISSLGYTIPPMTVEKTITIPNEPTEISADLILEGDFDPDGTPLILRFIDNVEGGTTNWTWEIYSWTSILFTPDGVSTEGRFSYTVYDGQDEDMWGIVNLVIEDSGTPTPTVTASPSPTITPVPTGTPVVTSTPEPTPTASPIIVPTPEPCLLEDKNIYFFVHSLVDYHSPTSTVEHRMPYWLSYLSDNNFTADGQFNFIREHVTPFNPTNQLGWPNIPSGWQGDFHSSNYSTVFITPRNFAQLVAPDHPYEDGTSGSPLIDSVELVRQSGLDKEFIIYASWPDMGTRNFPDVDLEEYYSYSMGDFYQWFVTLREGILAEEPTANIRIAPVGYMIARLRTETVLSELPLEALYEDDSPHGAPTLYLLAAMVTHIYLFGEAPDISADIQGNVHPLVVENYGNIVNYLMRNML